MLPGSYTMPLLPSMAVGSDMANPHHRSQGSAHGGLPAFNNMSLRPKTPSMALPRSASTRNLTHNQAQAIHLPFKKQLLNDNAQNNLVQQPRKYNLAKPSAANDTIAGLNAGRHRVQKSRKPSKYLHRALHNAHIKSLVSRLPSGGESQAVEGPASNVLVSHGQEIDVFGNLSPSTLQRLNVPSPNSNISSRIQSVSNQHHPTSFDSSSFYANKTQNDRAGHEIVKMRQDKSRNTYHTQQKNYQYLPQQIQPFQASSHHGPSSYSGLYGQAQLGGNDVGAAQPSFYHDPSTGVADHLTQGNHADGGIGPVQSYYPPTTVVADRLDYGQFTEVDHAQLYHSPAVGDPQFSANYPINTNWDSIAAYRSNEVEVFDLVPEVDHLDLTRAESDEEVDKWFIENMYGGKAPDYMQYPRV